MARRKKNITERLAIVEREQGRQLRLSRPVLNFVDAAYYLGVSRTELINLVELKKIKHHFQCGKIYINKAELDACLLTPNVDWISIGRVLKYLLKLAAVIITGHEMCSWN